MRRWPIILGAAGAVTLTLAAAALRMNGGGPDTHSRSARADPHHASGARALAPRPAPAARAGALGPVPARRPAAATDARLPAGADEARLEPAIRRVHIDPIERDPGVIVSAELRQRHGLGSWGALYADCDRSSGYEVLDQLDIMQFMLHYERRHPYADCDRSGEIDFFDLLCFMESLAASRGGSAP